MNILNKTKVIQNNNNKMTDYLTTIKLKERNVKRNNKVPQIFLLRTDLFRKTY